MSSGMVRASNPVVEAQLCGFSLSACSRNKYSPVVEVQLCRLVVGINIAYDGIAWHDVKVQN